MNKICEIVPLNDILGKTKVRQQFKKFKIARFKATILQTGEFTM
jgi:hypothetical protein